MRGNRPWLGLASPSTTTRLSSICGLTPFCIPWTHLGLSPCPTLSCMPVKPIFTIRNTILLFYFRKYFIPLHHIGA